MINKEILLLRTEIANAKDKVDNLEDEIITKTEKLQSVYKHEDTEKKERYIPGGYLDRAEYIIDTYCKICGKLLGTETKYGGFR